MLYQKNIFKKIVLFSGLPSQSSFVYIDFECSFESLESSLEITTVLDVVGA